MLSLLAPLDYDHYSQDKGEGGKQAVLTCLVYQVYKSECVGVVGPSLSKP